MPIVSSFAASPLSTLRIRAPSAITSERPRLIVLFLPPRTTTRISVSWGLSTAMSIPLFRKTSPHPHPRPPRSGSLLELRLPANENSTAKIPAANQPFPIKHPSSRDRVVAPEPEEQPSPPPQMPKSPNPRQRTPTGCASPTLGWIPQRPTRSRQSHLPPLRRAKNGATAGQELRTSQKSQ